MRVKAFVTVSFLLVFLLCLLNVGVSAEQVDHHGQMVDVGGDPRNCTVCHDGLVAQDARYCRVECGFGSSHSILKEYPPRMNESSYAPVESLQEKGIRLFNGKVSCESCHDLKKSTEYHLIMDNSGSVLCFSCHII